MGPVRPHTVMSATAGPGSGLTSSRTEVWLGPGADAGEPVRPAAAGRTAPAASPRSDVPVPISSAAPGRCRGPTPVPARRAPTPRSSSSRSRRRGRLAVSRSRRIAPSVGLAAAGERERRLVGDRSGQTRSTRVERHLRRPPAPGVDLGRPHQRAARPTVEQPAARTASTRGRADPPAGVAVRRPARAGFGVSSVIDRSPRPGSARTARRPRRSAGPAATSSTIRSQDGRGPRGVRPSTASVTCHARVVAVVGARLARARPWRRATAATSPSAGAGSTTYSMPVCRAGDPRRRPRPGTRPASARPRSRLVVGGHQRRRSRPRRGSPRPHAAPSR